MADIVIETYSRELASSSEAYETIVEQLEKDDHTVELRGTVVIEQRDATAGFGLLLELFLINVFVRLADRLADDVLDRLVDEIEKAIRAGLRRARPIKVTRTVRIYGPDRQVLREFKVEVSVEDDAEA